MIDAASREYFARINALQDRISSLLGPPLDWRFGLRSPKRGSVAFLISFEEDRDAHCVVCCLPDRVDALRVSGLTVEEWE